MGQKPGLVLFPMWVEINQTLEHLRPESFDVALGSSTSIPGQCWLVRRPPVKHSICNKQWMRHHPGPALTYLLSRLQCLRGQDEDFSSESCRIHELSLGFLSGLRRFLVDFHILRILTFLHRALTIQCCGQLNNPTHYQSALSSSFPR